MKRYTLYLKYGKYFAASVKPPQAEVCMVIKSFYVPAPYFLNAAAYAHVYSALVKLGYDKPDFTIDRIGPNRYRVDVLGEYFGVFDTHKKDFC